MNLQELYTKHSKQVFNLALQYVQNREDAEEITQDVFVKVHNSFDNFKQESKTAAKVTSITESVTTYTAVASTSKIDLEKLEVLVYPNPASDIVAVQIPSAMKENYAVSLYDMSGKLIQSTTLLQGSTIAHFDTRTLYSGEYVIEISTEAGKITKKIVLEK